MTMAVPHQHHKGSEAAIDGNSVETRHVENFDLLDPSGRRHKFRKVSRGDKVRNALVLAALGAVSLALFAMQAYPFAETLRSLLSRLWEISP